MAKYLGQTGLVYLWGKIKTWVGNYVKIVSGTGKDTITAGTNSVDIYDWAQASTKPSYTQDEITEGTTNKPFTDTEKTKLSGIASGAEVNQNAFSNVKVGSTTVAADAKTDTLTLEAGGDVTLTPDATNDKVTISVTTPKKTSDLTNDSGFITISDVPEGAAASTSTPLMDGTAAVGTELAFARGDHRHPSDTSKVNTSTTVNGHALTGNVTVTKSDIGLGSVTNDAQIPLTQKGAANGVCPLDANTKIDAQYLPSYVDDVVEAYIRAGQTALSATWLATGSASGTVITPQSGVIYVIMNGTDDYPTNSQYRWATNTYVKLNDGGISELTTSEMDTATNNWA